MRKLLLASVFVLAMAMPGFSATFTDICQGLAESGIQCPEVFEDSSVTLTLDYEATNWIDKNYKGLTFGLPVTKKGKAVFVGNVGINIAEGQECQLYFEGEGIHPTIGTDVDGGEVKLSMCINSGPSWGGEIVPLLNGTVNWPTPTSPITVHIYGGGYYRLEPLWPDPCISTLDFGNIFADLKWVITHHNSPDSTMWTTKLTGNTYSYSLHSSWGYWREGEPPSETCGDENWVKPSTARGPLTKSKISAEPLAGSGTQPQLYAGNWSGNWNSGMENGGGVLDVSVTQTGLFNISGNVTAWGSEMPQDQPYKGSVSGSAIKWVTTTFGGCSMTATGDAISYTQLSGTYGVTCSHQLVDSGTWSLDKQP
jgi:hypothetical protein